MNIISKERMVWRILPYTLSALLLVTPSMLKAQVRHIENINFLILSSSNPLTLIRLDINVPAGGGADLVITHSFVCAVEASDRITSLDTNIEVDDAEPPVVPPTQGLDDAAYTSTPPDTNSLLIQDKVTISRTVVKAVGPGVHTVRVRGRIANFSPGDRAFVDEQSLIVDIRRIIAG
jgi:hypothetical protein